METGFADIGPSSDASVYSAWTHENALQFCLWRILNPQDGLSIAEVNRFRRRIEQNVLLNSERPREGINKTRVRALTPRTQSLLADLTPAHFFHLRDSELASQLTSQLAAARDENHKGFRLWRSTSILGTAAVFSRISAREMIQTTGMWLGWKNLTQLDLQKFEDLIDHVLTVVRGSEPARTRIHATEILLGYLSDRSEPAFVSTWRKIVSSIIDNLHSWPLVVAGRGSNGGGYCLPTTIDVDYDENGVTRCIGMDGLARFDWGTALNRARHVANVFWGNQHNRLPDHKWRTENASVTLDVSATTKMLHLAGADEGGGAEDILEGQLIGRSLEAHLVVGILSCFMGRPASPRTAITGTIGEAIAQSEAKISDQIPPMPMNWRLGPVNGIEGKIRWAAKNANFHSSILPYENRVPSELVESSNQVASRVHYSRHLLNVVDTAFGDTWRRERYVRTPDIAYLMHLANTGQIDRIRQFDPRGKADKALAWLKAQRSTVVWGGAEIEPTEIALAFRKLNTSIRQDSKSAPYAKRSVCFLRIEEEQGARFVATLMDELGFRTDDIRRLLLSPNLEKATEIFANLVTEVEGGYGPRRLGFPDLLVLLLPPQSQSDSFNQNHLNADRLLSDSLSERIRVNERKLHQSEAMKAWKAEAGPSRIIILDDKIDHDHFRTPDFSACDTSRYQWYIRCLRELPIGFTSSQMKAVLSDGCGVSSDELDDLVSDLVSRNLIIETFSGSLLNPRIFGNDQELTELWTVNRCIASALTPYIAEQFRGTDESSFSLRSIHEAQSQLSLSHKRAIAHSHNGRDIDNINEIKNGIFQSNIVLDVFQQRSWASLYFLSKAGGNFKADSLVEEVSSWLDEFGQPALFQMIGFTRILAQQHANIRNSSVHSADAKRYLLTQFTRIFHGVDWAGIRDAEFTFVWSNVERLIVRYPELEGCLSLERDEIARLRYRCADIVSDNEVALDYAIEKDWLLYAIEHYQSPAGIRSALMSYGRRCFWFDTRFWEHDLTSCRKSVPSRLWRDILYFCDAESRIKSKVKRHIRKFCSDPELRKRMLTKLI